MREGEATWLRRTGSGVGFRDLSGKPSCGFAAQTTSCLGHPEKKGMKRKQELGNQQITTPSTALYLRKKVIRFYQPTNHWSDLPPYLWTRG
jgi:hypothetical protein